MGWGRPKGLEGSEMLRYRIAGMALEAIARIALAERAERLIPGFLRQN